MEILIVPEDAGFPEGGGGEGEGHSRIFPMVWVWVSCLKQGIHFHYLASCTAGCLSGLETLNIV